MTKERPTMPEILELPFVCMTCGGQLEIAASERTKKHRRRWLCGCTPKLDLLEAVPLPSTSTSQEK